MMSKIRGQFKDLARQQRGWRSDAVTVNEIVGWPETRNRMPEVSDAMKERGLPAGMLGSIQVPRERARRPLNGSVRGAVMGSICTVAGR